MLATELDEKWRTLKTETEQEDMMSIIRSLMPRAIMGDYAIPSCFVVVVAMIGFVKDAKDHVDVQGFNVYHKNRPIKLLIGRASLWYDFGATSGASISLKSVELSGTTWFNLSAVQLGLMVNGSLYGALAGSIAEAEAKFKQISEAYDENAFKSLQQHWSFQQHKSSNTQLSSIRPDNKPEFAAPNVNLQEATTATKAGNISFNGMHKLLCLMIWEQVKGVGGIKMGRKAVAGGGFMSPNMGKGVGGIEMGRKAMAWDGEVGGMGTWGKGEAFDLVLELFLIRFLGFSV